MLVDSHCHLDFPDFGDELAAVVDRAARAGVARMVTVCTRPSRLSETLAIAETMPQVYVAVGVHPHEAAAEPALSVDDLVALARHPRIVAIGETGLDYHYDHSPRPVQQARFRQHIAAARAAGVPLVVHTRQADDDTIRILEEEGAGGDGADRLTGVIHCFSGGRDLAEAALRWGFCISFSGILTFKAAGDLRDIARDLPVEQLLVETDAPYLAPVPKRGKRNEPAFVVHTAETLATVKGMAPADIARQTTENFFALFTKVPRPDAMAA
ncbi:MAG: TatD family hydrolase [Rhodospirillaceae bacterium]|nr:TatD family hydrolase [Rhodospirillaceae bacterium]